MLGLPRLFSCPEEDPDAAAAAAAALIMKVAEFTEALSLSVHA